MATWHKNTCDICGDEASVTEPRDYGHLKDTWIKAAESRSGGQQNCKHCGSTEDFWWSRTEPMGYYCSDCGKEYEPERTMNTDTPRTDEWETYCDESYYHLWRVRRKNERGFNDGYHVNNGDEARALVDLLNKQDSELNAVTEQRDEALSDLEFRRDLFKLQEQQLNDVRAERDRLAEAIITHRAKAFPLNGEDYDLELWQALQSLTTNKNHKP